MYQTEEVCSVVIVSDPGDEQEGCSIAVVNEPVSYVL